MSGQDKCLAGIFRCSVCGFDASLVDADRGFWGPCVSSK